ncbi:minor capsid protein [Lysinibacillus sp. NPDC096212]|uniref:minor capsid protein n=1 Tax=Lysinibacillus sp. NPDC096212 TaxID=3364135 RepID=UPI0037F8042E
MSKGYWESRSAQREMESQLIASKYLAKMDESLREAQQDILRQIESFYSRYAVENQVSIVEARKYLTAKELRDFKDIDLKRFREMSLLKNPEYDRILNATSYRARITRLEALNMQIEMRMAQLYGGVNGLQEYAYTGLTDVYKNTYYRTMFDFHKVGAFTGTVAATSNNTMKEILSYNWSGKEFSQRIWGQQESTRQTIRKELERSFASGRSIQKTTKAIMDVTDVSRSRVEALVRTEANFFHNAAAQESYGDAGIDRYEILATLDNRTSKICREQDGKIYKEKDYKPGETAPPFHVRCRSTTIPYFDESEYMEGEKRQSADGLIDSVSYEEWKATYVENEQIRNQESIGDHKVYPIKKSNVKWDNHFAIGKKGSEVLNEVHSNLNEFMNTKRLEKLFLIDKSTNSVAFELSGQSIDQVIFTKELIQALKSSKSNSLVLAHVHPTKTPFSKEDIRKMIDFKSISELTLEGADGSKYLLSRDLFKSSFLKSLSFYSNYDKIYWNIAKKYPDLEDELKRIDVWDDFLFEVNKEVANFYGMKFKKVE